MDHFQYYEADDFVMVESFQKWVLKKDPEAVQFWERWIVDHPDKQDEIVKAVEIIRALSNEKNVAQATDHVEVWQKVQDSLFVSEKKPSKKLNFRYWYYSAACLALLIVTVFSFWTLSQQDDKVYVATGFGETLELLLPDSTRVTLNANSSLSYLPEWDDLEKERVVWMEGEGFFDVSHRNRQKFIVRTEQVAVEVLGTKFNVSERRGNTEVILSTGKVALYLQEEKVLMDPGEKVSYDAKTQKVDKRVVNPELLTSWRKNELTFEATPLSEIAFLLEDQYGYQVKFEDEDLRSLLFSGVIRADNVDLLLEALSETHRITISQENDTLIFMK
jgi:ferric-dicitrate binding protein FerR (iron transport regulator)